MRIIGIDPGNETSAYVIYQDAPEQLIHACLLENAKLQKLLRFRVPGPMDLIAIEQIAYQGRSRVGAKTFDTIRWEERFRVAAITGGYSVELVTRNVARTRIAGSHANDTLVQRALVERFGRKETRGLNVHTQAALAVAVVAGNVAARDCRWGRTPARSS